MWHGYNCKYCSRTCYCTMLMYYVLNQLYKVNLISIALILPFFNNGYTYICVCATVPCLVGPGLLSLVNSLLRVVRDVNPEENEAASKVSRRLCIIINNAKHDIVFLFDCIDAVCWFTLFTNLLFSFSVYFGSISAPSSADCFTWSCHMTFIT